MPARRSPTCPSSAAALAGEPSLEGFIAAKVLVDGLKCAGREPTLESLNDFDVGGYYVTYTSSDHTGPKFIKLTAIGKDGVFVR